MADPLTINVQQAAKAAPATYTVAGSAEIEILSAFASFDGTAAAAAYLPSLAFYSAAGLLISRSFPSSSVAAGASADVSYFPGVSTAAASSGGGGGPRQVLLPLDAPDSAANGFIAWAPNYGVSNLRALVPALATSLDGSWEGRIRIPDDYSSAGAIALSFIANATTGNLRVRVSTAVVADAVSENTAYTAEAYVALAASGTALRRFTTTFTLSTALVAGSTLNYKIDRNGTNGADTLLVDALLWHAAFTYTSS